MYNTLIIDDDRDTLELMDSFFPKTQFATYLEANLAGAYKVIERVHPDLILSDVVLGGESGFEVIEYLKGARLSPVLFMITGYDDVKGEDAYERDAHMFLRKPVVSPVEMVSAALRHLRKRPMQSQNFPLSKREQQIMQLISQGLTTQDISEFLGISARTVSKHRENMLRRCKVKNIVELISKVGRSSQGGE